MPYNEAQKNATIKYMKKLKRIPLDVQPEQYEKIKEYADKEGKGVNTIIKEIVYVHI